MKIITTKKMAEAFCFMLTGELLSFCVLAAIDSRFITVFVLFVSAAFSFVIGMRPFEILEKIEKTEQKTRVSSERKSKLPTCVKSETEFVPSVCVVGSVSIFPPENETEIEVFFSRGKNDPVQHISEIDFGKFGYTEIISLSSRFYFGSGFTERGTVRLAGIGSINSGNTIYPYEVKK